MSFELLGTDGAARRGRLTFPRGTVETPAFMPRRGQLDELSR
jgi:queuine tRNA-ribosyltransferase